MLPGEYLEKIAKFKADFARTLSALQLSLQAQIMDSVTALRELISVFAMRF